MLTILFSVVFFIVMLCSSIMSSRARVFSISRVKCCVFLVLGSMFRLISGRSTLLLFVFFSRMLQVMVISSLFFMV